ncbi:MAG: hypothetical protein ACRERS_06405, partial [Methylococcales bacterium]
GEGSGRFQLTRGLCPLESRQAWGQVKQVADWPYSIFPHFVARGIYPKNWRCNGMFEVDGGE